MRTNTKKTEALFDSISDIFKILSVENEMKVSEWVAKYRYINNVRWSHDLTPYLVEIMDKVHDVNTHTVVLKCSAQIGKTELINCLIAYFIAKDPCPIIFQNPIDQQSEEYITDRFVTMMKASPFLKDIYMRHMTGNRSGSTKLHKSFPGGFLSMVTSQTPAKLASKPCRIAIGDDIDRFKYSTGKEGDPVSLMEKRMTTFYDRFMILCSTPTADGFSKIDDWYKKGDQHKYFVPCPYCNHYQTLRWESLRWDFIENSKKIDNKSLRYICESCAGEIKEDAHKFTMINAGKWEMVKEGVMDGVASYHLNEIYSLLSSWVKMATDWNSKKDIPVERRVFINTSLGEVYVDKQTKVEWEMLYERAKNSNYSRGEIPYQVKVLTAGADIQKDRIEVEVVGWGARYQSWSIDYHVIKGDTRDINSPCWKELSRIIRDSQGNRYIRKDGVPLAIEGCFIDTGWEGGCVYKFIENENTFKFQAIKGVDSENITEYVSAKKNIKYFYDSDDHEGEVRHIHVTLFKLELYNYYLSLPENKSDSIGFCRFPRDYPPQYYRMLCSERYVIEADKWGNERGRFVKFITHNEALDCRVYASACARVLGVHTADEETWENFEQNFLMKRVELRSKGENISPILDPIDSDDQIIDTEGIKPF